MTRVRDLFILLVLCLLAFSGSAIAQLRGHDSHGLLPKTFTYGGYLETKYAHYRLNRDSAFYACPSNNRSFALMLFCNPKWS